MTVLPDHQLRIILIVNFSVRRQSAIFFALLITCSNRYIPLHIPTPKPNDWILSSEKISIYTAEKVKFVRARIKIHACNRIKTVFLLNTFCLDV